jgi:hypothetical protein
VRAGDIMEKMKFRLIAPKMASPQT